LEPSRFERLCQRILRESGFVQAEVTGRSGDRGIDGTGLVELCGLPANPANEGVSLVPLLRDPGADWDRPILTTYGRTNHTLRTKRYRYIRYEDGSEELYDHASDPNEWRNLATAPTAEQAALMAQLRERLPKRNAPWAKDASLSVNPYFDDHLKRHRDASLK